jgi:hypothetical protein
MNKLTQLTVATLTMVGMAGFAVAGDTKADPKAAPKAAEPAKAAPPAMAMPKAPQELADMMKGMAGTWKCDGTGMGMDMKETKFTGKMTSKLDLDGFWGHDTFEGTMGAAKFKFESFMTYDSNGKKWHSVFVDNMGSMMMGSSDGMKDMKMDVLADTMGPMGKGQFKDHMDASDMKKGVHMWGEMSMDGKTFNKVYDMTCKK